MHINNWVHASDLMKMMKSANSISTLSSEEGLPDNHVITIRERELTVDFPELIQNNIKTDTVTLDLDKEWDGIHPVIIFGPNASGTIAVEYTGEPVHIPGAVMQYVGGLDCSVMGLDDSGEVRLVTKAAPNTFEVVESGEYIGQISEDDVSLLGQILSAIEDVEAATSDASSAAEAATAAANSANTAATKATNAANSANTAATKATDAANSANTASERAENAYDALTPIIAEIGVNGNQPRATTNPNYIATANDAYAAKPLEICIKGETRQNLWVNPSGTVNGITATSNEDGTITLSGTTNSPTSTIQVQSYALKPSTQYTFSVDKEIPGGNTGFVLVQLDESGQAIGSNIVIGKDGYTSNTFTTQSNMSRVRMQVYCNRQDTTVSGTYRVMLNEGSTAQPWCPPGLNSVQAGNLVTAGKNLLDIPDTQKITGYGGTYTFTLGDDGSVTCSVSNDLRAWSYKTANVKMLLPAGTYTLSLSISEYVPGCGIRAYRSDEKLIVQFQIYDGTNIFGSFTLDAPTEVGIMYKIANVKGYPQLELGSTATDYEPPNITQTPLPEVELRSLPNGTCDELVIAADGTCEVERRTHFMELDGSIDENITRGTIKEKTQVFRVATDIPVTLGPNIMCDILPTASGLDMPLITGGHGKDYGAIYIAVNKTDASTVDEFRAWLTKNKPKIVCLTDESTEPQSPVTLPTLPSPNITVYHDSDVPSDITVEYVQDINIVLDNLNAKIAALNIAQSISS